MAGAATQTKGALDYGIDAPALTRSWYHRAGWTLGFGLLVWIINRQEYPATAAELFAVLTVFSAACAAVAAYRTWSSRTGKIQLREQLLDQLALKGDEKVLDVGCGRGLMAIGAAKRLKTGKVTAIDTWDPESIAGNSQESAKENAKAEGVAERVRFETGDPRKLVYPANNFDVVLSFAALHRLADDRERDQAVTEILRVLKPGGRVLIFDTAETGYLAERLRASGAQDVTLSAWKFLWCQPSRSIMARK
jgi:ubiquinone/menaquinone biosynthesis C-methylase UbiE